MLCARSHLNEKLNEALPPEVADKMFYRVKALLVLFAYGCSPLYEESFHQNKETRTLMSHGCIVAYDFPSLEILEKINCIRRKETPSGGNGEVRTEYILDEEWKQLVEEIKSEENFISRMSI